MATANYGWVLPTVDGSNGVWGELLNDILDTGTNNLDDLINTIQTVANAALPKAGGTMTGELVTLTQTFTVVNLGATMSGATPMDLDAANAFYGTCTGNVTFSFSNVPAGAVFVTLEITNAGGFTITWPSGTIWPGGAAPTFTTTGTDIVVFYTRDSGTTWHAAASMLDVS